MQNLADRIELLETQLRRLRITALCSLTLGMVLFLAGAAYSQHEGLMQVPANSLASRSFRRLSRTFARPG